MSADCVTLERQDNGLYTVIIDDIMHTDMPYKKSLEYAPVFFPEHSPSSRYRNFPFQPFQRRPHHKREGF